MTMSVPNEWVDEVSRALAPEAYAPREPLQLSLTYRAGLPQRLADIGASVDEVKADLSNGFSSDRRNGRDGEYYCLSGSRFDVFVNSQPEENTGLPLAVVTAVKPLVRLARRDAMPDVSVDFYVPRAQESCDIAFVHVELGRLRRQQRLRQQVRVRARGLLSTVRVGGLGHAEVHARIRRQYSPLLTVIDLLRTLSDTEGRVQAAGTVVDPGGAGSADEPLVCVRIARATGTFRQSAEVTVATSARRWTLELVAVQDDLIYLEPPERGELAPRDNVKLEQQDGFRLKRHAYALARFLEEDVVGDWTALARLLSAPNTLAVPTAPATLTFYDEELNPRQRAAVAGAVAAPHAYFVQGPPGTGKTTVITEIVRQLVARGERVLLVASMHVAVDEVLRRVADADGVFALRFSKDDSRVRDELRRFLPEQVVAEFARRAARPARSKEPRWRAELEHLVVEQQTLLAVADGRRALRDAHTRRADAGQLAQEWQSEHGAAMVVADAASTLARQHRDHAHQRWAEASRAQQAVEAELAAAKAGRTFGDRLAGLFGRGALRPLRKQRDLAEQALAAAQAEHAPLAEAAAHAAADQHALAAAGAAARQEHERVRAQIAQQILAARRRARTAEEASRTVLDPADPSSVSDEELSDQIAWRRSRADRLERFIYLERRWHEIAGLAGTPAAGVEQVLTEMGSELLQAANLIGCTATGFGGQPAIRETDFDTVIVDEASRVTDSEFLISAKQARRWVLVGDEHQLPPYVHAPDEHHLHALAALHMAERGAAPDLTAAVKHLGTLWREDEELHRFRDEPVQRRAERLRDSAHWQRHYRSAFQTAYERLGQDDGDGDRELLAAMRTHLVQSLFERCVADCPPALRQRLIEQRRMIDPIAAIVRTPIYGGEYRSPPAAELHARGVTPLVGETLREPVVFMDTSGQPKAAEQLQGTGITNTLEADWAVWVCRLWERELRRRAEPKQVTLSVLTLYSAQAQLIRTRLGHPNYPDFRALKIEKVDSIDAIQGQESDLVIVSFCRTRTGRMGEGFGLWLQDVRRLNVACTRARRSLVLIGHRHTLQRLSTVDEAKVFYRHLFGLFDQQSPGTLVVRELR
jgi:AAA domain